MMNSPDESIFPFRPACVRPPFSDKPIVAMYHGTLVERNGLDVAVKAIALLRNRLPSAQLHIYGKATPFLERVMQWVEEQGLPQNVLHLGEKPLEEIVNAIDGCDVGIIPNRLNAFTHINTPTRIFEYLARGKPVIAPRTAGIQDYFGDDSLLYFEPGEPEEIAQKIGLVASHVEQILAITKRGQEVYQRHTWKQEAQTLVRVVEKLLEPDGRNHTPRHRLLVRDRADTLGRTRS
jgi:glycosyltransferase involved in cell wall biosynthesis